MWEILLETGQVSVTIFFLIISASIYSRMLAMSGIPDFLGTWLSSLNIGLYGFLLIYIVILLLLGCIIDAASTMLIAGPLAIPVAQMYGADPIWFGIVTVIGAEVGLLTPPFGMSVYAVKATLADESVGPGRHIFRVFPVRDHDAPGAFPGIRLPLVRPGPCKVASPSG